MQPVVGVEQLGNGGTLIIEGVGRRAGVQGVIEPLELAAIEERIDVGTEVAGNTEITIGRRQIGISVDVVAGGFGRDRQQPRVTGTDRATLQQDQRSEEHTSELQSLMRISYAVI